MNIINCIMENSENFRRGRTRDGKPQGIVVHSTGADNPRLSRYVQPAGDADPGRLGKNQYGNDWNHSGELLGVHAFIGLDRYDTICVVNTLPHSLCAWHCGGSANNTHLAFEICEDKRRGASYLIECLETAAELCAEWCMFYGWDPLADGVILSHAEAGRRGLASAHGDPDHWMSEYGITMDSFRHRVAEIMEMNGPVPESAPDHHWNEEARTFCEKNGIMSGRWTEPATRDELAAVAYRLYKLLEK